jgi:thioredoxin 1
MTFADLTNTDKPVLVDFYADWCAPCRAMKPVLEDLKAQMGEELSIFKIDVDKNQAISERYAIRSIPTLILFKNGEPVWRKSGMASSVELKKAVEKSAEA